jgi:stage II sporulation protein P
MHSKYDIFKRGVFLFINKRILVRRSRRSFYRHNLVRKGSSSGRDFTPVLMIIGLIIAIIFFIYPLGAGAFLNFGNIKTIIAERVFCVDYLTLISNSLPGMGPANIVSDKEAGLPFKSPLWRDYPQMLLSNELAGLQVLEASKMFYPSAAGDDSGILGGEIFLEGEEGVSFLAEKGTELSREKPFTFEGEKPLLLIYHTHASESFLPVSGKIYAADPDQTVVSLGAALTKMLQDDYGLPVLHHQEVFDRPRRYAYEKAGPAIEKILQQNPQIQVVLDLHRDGVSRKITTSNVAGQETARVLFVIGTRHEGWSSNLRFALFLENILQEKYPDFSRGILKNVYDCYNQHLHPRSLIVEIGGYENSEEELQRAIPYLAEVLASTFE